jgi:NADPH2:quinone reductase
MKAIRVNQAGNPSVMKLEDISLPELKESELLIQNKVAGVNGKDILLRNGTYATTFPYTPGIEGAGIVIEKERSVTHFQVGDRVAYCHGGSGSYAENTIVPSNRVVHLPNQIDFPVGAGCLVQGLVAHYLIHSTYPLDAGQTVLVHAAAGGVGLLLIQLAKLKGARVIGTVSTPEKAKIASNFGADQIILYSQLDFAEETMKLTNDFGVDVVYDSVGLTTFEKSLKVLKNRGLLVSVGQSSGQILSFDLNKLANSSSQRGSFYLTRPTTNHYIQGNEFSERIDSLFDYIIQGKLKILIGQQYFLKNVSQAHQDLCDRQTVGKSLIGF